jgi:uncharacterized protein
MADAFDWDEAKAAENYAKHGVSFETATKAFKDPFGIERSDDREDYGEERLILIAMAEQTMLTIVYTEKDENIRIISARYATKNEQDAYFVENT